MPYDTVFLNLFQASLNLWLYQGMQRNYSSAVYCAIGIKSRVGKRIYNKDNECPNVSMITNYYKSLMSGRENKRSIKQSSQNVRI